MNAPDFPTPWQRKTLWSALTALAVVTIGAIAAGLIWLLSQALDFLQPILVPFAVAAVLAYLLDPAVTTMVRWGTSRARAVVFVFAIVTILFTGVGIWILPALSTQSINLARKVPRYTQQARLSVVRLSDHLRQTYGLILLPPPIPQKGELTPGTAAEKTTPLEVATTGTADVLPPAANEPLEEHSYVLQQFINGNWLQETLRQASTHAVHLLRDSLGGFLGVLGFLLSMIIVPIYLFYFLLEGPNIEESWSDYLPLRASAFKDEVVSTLSEINGYLIAFFRGQLVVSVINGVVTGLGLVTVGLEFGLLIGLALCLLGIIPYIGITICWVVAVVIASVQGGSAVISPGSWWVFPLVVTGIFVVVHHVDNLFVTPKIVGDSVGLHPLTVIFSVFAWSLLMGGLLGAILAVPMTATVKVLLRRYVWERRFRGAESTLMVLPETLAAEPTGVVMPAAGVPAAAAVAARTAGQPAPVL